MKRVPCLTNILENIFPSTLCLFFLIALNNERRLIFSKEYLKNVPVASAQFYSAFFPEGPGQVQLYQRELARKTLPCVGM